MTLVTITLLRIAFTVIFLISLTSVCASTGLYSHCSRLNDARNFGSFVLVSIRFRSKRDNLLLRIMVDAVECPNKNFYLRCYG